ncbi:23S rRNA (uracil(1939)-C(5))-methyltransferase [Halomonas aestuarii]|uniref:23S rRNA (uracil(1939)-C(5))-methyltransferase RlmD n=1 Tax=Halomonas aestuarii TaxID=1897729 RepID=A0A1J0VCG3_9GAMM|nr:TRAM domain-containing protein [Halomonas aestuarii]APE29695.1 23S rRNA (uracil(1939)-C(5))-methyltransferase [Halomonas aestuarii]
MAMLGKRRPKRAPSGVSGLQGRQADTRHAPAPPPEQDVLEIHGLAHDGRGVARAAQGKTVFVEGALPGERVRVAVHRTRKRFDEAHVREVLTPSPERVEPPCPHFGRCGGCDLQHLALPAQRRHKSAVLEELLGRQGITLASPPELLAGAGEGYRRRARLGVKVDADGQVHLGFRARHTHRLVDIEACTVLVPALAAQLVPLHLQLAELEAPRQVGHLELLECDQGVVLVVRQLRDHTGDTRRWQAFAERQGVHLARWLGRDAPDLEWLTPMPSLTCRVPGPAGEIALGVAPGDFLQANAEVNCLMVGAALSWLAPYVDDARLLDLFAGVGNFSLPLAEAGARVTAAEGSPAMVERLAENARATSPGRGPGVEARQADLAAPAAVHELLASTRPEVVVLDPPREGAESVSRALQEHPVPRVLYISCDPATLARDAAHLVHGGYRIVRAAVADMFVHTSHLESMLLFEYTGSARHPQGAPTDG